MYLQKRKILQNMLGPKKKIHKNNLQIFQKVLSFGRNLLKDFWANSLEFRNGSDYMYPTEVQRHNYKEQH